MESEFCCETSRLRHLERAFIVSQATNSHQWMENTSMKRNTPRHAHTHTNTLVYTHTEQENCILIDDTVSSCEKCWERQDMRESVFCHQSASDWANTMYYVIIHRRVWLAAFNRRSHLTVFCQLDPASLARLWSNALAAGWYGSTTDADADQLRCLDVDVSKKMRIRERFR